MFNQAFIQISDGIQMMEMGAKRRDLQIKTI